MLLRRVSQVMVFVHARNATVRTGMALIEMAKNRGEASFFQPDHGADYGQCDKQVGARTHTHTRTLAKHYHCTNLHHVTCLNDAFTFQHRLT